IVNFLSGLRHTKNVLSNAITLVHLVLLRSCKLCVGSLELKALVEPSKLCIGHLRHMLLLDSLCCVVVFGCLGRTTSLLVGSVASLSETPPHPLYSVVSEDGC